MSKIAIVGSRNYKSTNVIRTFIDTLSPDDVIVSGGAQGVDTVAYETAKEKGMECVVFYADWDRYGKPAGYIRNKQIVEYADLVVAFWDGTSKGTKHSIDLAKSMGKPCIICRELPTNREPAEPGHRPVIGL